jgi:zona occludens toxin
MLVFNEGVPGAGKSYDAVAEHILPALKAGRVVYARLNGLQVEKIASYLGVDPSHVQELLHQVKSADVLESFRAVRDEHGEFVIPDKFRNALIVIDEVHEFYTAARDKLPEDVEQFFAIQRHFGIDVILITQWYKRMHTALRARIERKNVFQKLTVMGRPNSYRVTFWQTVAPDKYEKVGGATRKYDPVIWTLYSGVADGDVSTAVYESGGMNLWKSMLPKLIAAAVVVAVGAYTLLHFFSSGGGFVKEKPVSVSRPMSSSGSMTMIQPESLDAYAATKRLGVTAADGVPLRKPVKTEGMTPEQAYVWDLGDKARIRVAAVLGPVGHEWGLLEWRPANGEPMESLTTRQLQAMGVAVTHTPYGFKLVAQGQMIVATQWPINEPLRPQKAELYRLDGPSDGGIHAGFASNASNTGAGAVGVQASSPASFQSVASYGAMGVGASQR